MQSLLLRRPYSHCHTGEFLVKSFHNHQQPPPPTSDQRNQQTPANLSTTVSRYPAKAMASKNESTDSQPAELDKTESYLLKLSPELRNVIYKLILSSAPEYYISDRTRPRKPGFLQLNKQIRAEKTLMYYALKHFTVLFAMDTLPVVHN
jgi:hypothetical protein